MYLWKCWRDTRGTFFTLLAAVLAVGAFGGYVALDPFGWIAAKPLESRVVWQGSTGALVATLIGLVPFAGFFLGALGVGLEFEKRTADFLLTRPRSRRYFLWTSWGLGAAQMIALVLLSLAGIWLTRFASSPKLSARVFAAMCVVALIIYSVTYLMTTLARNSRHGTSLGVAVFIGYSGLYVWVRLWYDTEIPLPWIPWELTFGSFRGAGALFPITAMIGWLIVCLALTLAAQLVFERAEV